jgi:hypothetical protein
VACAYVAESGVGKATLNGLNEAVADGAEQIADVCRYRNAHN